MSSDENDTQALSFPLLTSTPHRREYGLGSSTVSTCIAPRTMRGSFQWFLTPNSRHAGHESVISTTRLHTVTLQLFVDLTDTNL
ncbi:hypothetical protein TNCV_4030431 [Trichonephila clavipes]|nr:hypothetical protein TNCV_4030431 [Trichonephila clavipes]